MNQKYKRILNKTSSENQEKIKSYVTKRMNDRLKKQNEKKKIKDDGDLVK